MPKKKFTESDINNAIYEHVRRGRPEKANRIRSLRDEGKPIPGELLDLSGVKSEKPIEEKLEIPARNAKTDEWQEFAAKVSDFDSEVLEKMGRDEIIEVLEQREIIPTTEEEAEEGDDEGEDE